MGGSCFLADGADGRNTPWRPVRNASPSRALGARRASSGGGLAFAWASGFRLVPGAPPPSSTGTVHRSCSLWCNMGLSTCQADEKVGLRASGKTPPNTTLRGSWFLSQVPFSLDVLNSAMLKSDLVLLHGSPFCPWTWPYRALLPARCAVESPGELRRPQNVPWRASNTAGWRDDGGG